MALKHISLQDIKAVELNYGVADTLLHGWKMEVHLDAPAGKLLGTAVIGVKAPLKKPLQELIRLQPAEDAAKHDLYFVFHKIDAADKGGIAVASFRFVAK